MEDCSDPVIEIMTLQKGEFLFRQGDSATSAYILAYGAIAIFKENSEERIPIARLNKGTLFGEMAIIDSRPRANSAMAIEDSTLSLVSKDMIVSKLKNSDKMVRLVLDMLSNSIKSIQKVYELKEYNISDLVCGMRNNAQEIQIYLDNLMETSSKEKGLVLVKKIIKITEDISDGIPDTPSIDSSVSTKGLEI